LISRLQDHNIFFMTQGTNQHGQDALYVYCTPTNLADLTIGEISINMMDGSVTVIAKSKAGYMPALFLQAAKFLLSATV
jgi:Beta2-adaptin appendage, C-terminal sub-domain